MAVAGDGRRGRRRVAGGGGSRATADAQNGWWLPAVANAHAKGFLRGVTGRNTLTPEEAARYSRHIMLPEIGLDGQQRLKAARVLVVGAGGLGSPAALYLAAAGVGTIGLADFDRVEAHNLQRQILHGTADVGRAKTASGAKRLADLNPHVRVIEHADGVRPENATQLFREYDVIVDGSDNFPTRYLNTDAAFLAGRALVYGSIFKFEGQITVFDPPHGGPCYRCLFPEPPPPGSVPNCGEAGVLGALCGVIGSLQALEVVKRLTGAGTTLVGRLLVFDALATSFRTLNLRKDPDCPLCSARATIRTIEADRYAEGCAPEPAGAADGNGRETASGAAELPLEIDVGEAAQLARSGRGMIVDVREPFELRIAQIDGARHIPMRQIPAQLDALPHDQPLLVLCHSGARSLQVTQFLRAHGFANASNIRGGINAWTLQVDPSLPRY